MPEAAVTTGSQASRPDDQGAAPDHARLHISPFDAHLLSVVIPASILPNARNISFHTVESDPAKRFGFVDLPVADAERIRKKLNGTVLKGAKMRVDKARPETWQEQETEKPVSDKKRKKNKDEGPGEKKKRKKDYNVVEGIELEDGRKVKRGWTVTAEDKIKEKRKSKKEREQENSGGDAAAKDKKKQKKREERSKYSDKEECLIRTKLPGGPPPPTAAADPEDADRKKRKKDKARETVVHEFANTTKFPTFLRANKASTTDSGATEFVEGKGWVDAEGNVVEPVKSKRAARSASTPKKKKAAAAPPPEEDTSSSESESSSEDEAPSKPAAPVTKSVSVVDPADDTSSSGDSSDESDSGRGTAEPPNTAVATPAKSILKTRPAPVAEEDDETSSSGTSSEGSDSDSDTEKPSTAAAIAPSPIDTLKNDTRPKSSSSNVSLTIKIPPPPPMTPGKVHPLEALYKRNKEAAADGEDEAQPFSFFGGGSEDADEDENGVTTQAPMTPFTQKDFEWRNVRSAAPTPDTAHPKTKNFWAIGSEGADEEMVDDDVDLNEGADGEGESSSAAAAAASGPGGEFQKWFWENRRDLNRSWMQRKKTVAKEKRHRDNKSRAAKAV